MKRGWLKEVLEQSKKEYDSLTKWMRDRMDASIAQENQKREEESKNWESKSYSDIAWITGTGGYGQ